VSTGAKTQKKMTMHGLSLKDHVMTVT